MNVSSVGKTSHTENFAAVREYVNRSDNGKNASGHAGDHAELSAEARGVISEMREKAARKRAELIETALKDIQVSESRVTLSETDSVAFRRVFSVDDETLAKAREFMAKASEKPDLSFLDEFTGKISDNDKALDTIRAALRDTAEKAAETAKTAVGETNAAQQPEEKEKTLSEMLAEQQEKLESLFSRLYGEDSKAHKINAIRMKMRGGYRLSASDQAYLSVNDPDMYERYQKVECARRSYRNTLNSCRTKDQVNGMQLSNALSALGQYKKACRNGSGDEVIGLYSALNREINEFKHSGGYSALPTNAECGKFQKDLAKARKFEQEKKAAKRREQLEKLKKKRFKKKKKKLLKTPGDGKQTVAQVMNSPTAKKVIGSMSKPRYMGYSFDYYSKIGKK